jgi:hypothetical protein
MNEEVRNIAKFWVNRIKHLVSAINNAALDDESESIVDQYKTIINIQPESKIYLKFNKKFNELLDFIDKNFKFDFDRNKSFRILSPDLRRSNYDKWLKLRFAIIDVANKFELEFNELVNKNIKPKISVEEIMPTYNQSNQSIFFGDHQIPMDRDEKQHAFCDVLFNKMSPGEAKSWDLFWEEMGGALENKKDADKKIKKLLYDLHRNINSKVKKTLKNDNACISEWKNKNVVRVGRSE